MRHIKHGKRRMKPLSEQFCQHRSGISEMSADIKQVVKYPKPCVQCGKCCREEVCPIGQLLIRTTTPPCPALEKGEGKYWCGITRHPSCYIHPSIGLEEGWQTQFMGE